MEGILDKNIEKEINNNIEENNITIDDQKSFLETTFGKTINAGIDIAIKALLPDFIEDQIIEVKDVLLSEGLKDGIKTLIDSAVDLGKSTLGIFTGKFENISQVETVVKNGGILDGISGLLDKAIDKAQSKDLINNTVAKLLKKGKETIVKTVNDNIEKSITNQIEAVEKVNEYSEKWNTYYNERDFDKMDKEYNKIKDKLEELVPLENVIKKAREIENLHMLIKNRGGNFEISNEELELAKVLAY